MRHHSFLSSIPAVALVMVVSLAACSTPAGPVAESTTTSGPAPPVSLRPAEIVGPPSTAPSTSSEVTDVRGLITPSGVPVAVVARSGDTYSVTSPCGDRLVVRGGTPIGTTTVVLDPGHGGPVDTGAQAPTGLVEAPLNLRVAGAVEERLQSRGVSVAMTRTGDYPTTLPVRAAFADRLGASMLVSIHHNSPIANPSATPGTEVFVQSDSPASQRLGGLLYEEVTAALSRFDVEWSAAPDAGVLRVLLPDGDDAYGILRRPATPAALVELGYLANRPEAELFATDEYIDSVADAIASAIGAHLETGREGSGYGNPPRVFRPSPAPGRSQCTDPPLE